MQVESKVGALVVTWIDDQYARVGLGAEFGKTFRVPGGRVEWQWPASVLVIADTARDRFRGYWTRREVAPGFRLHVGTVQRWDSGRVRYVEMPYEQSERVADVIRGAIAAAWPAVEAERHAAGDADRAVRVASLRREIDAARVELSRIAALVDDVEAGRVHATVAPWRVRLDVQGGRS